MITSPEAETGAVKRLIRRALSTPRLLAVGGARRYVFCYHDISEPDWPAHSLAYSTRPEVFREQIETLSKHFEWVGLDELVRSDRPRRHLAALTFDDGFVSVRHEAWPFLRQKGIPSAIFVCRLAVEHNCLPVSTRVLLGRSSGFGDVREHLGIETSAAALYDADADARVVKNLDLLKIRGVLSERVYMDAEDLRYLHDRGVLVGSHAQTHKALSRCSSAELEDEIGGNRAFVEKTLAIRSEHFALPFGKRSDYTPAVLDVLQRHGYRFVYTTNPVYVTGTATGPVRLVPRIGVTNEDPRRLTFYLNRPLLKRIEL